MLAGVSVAMHQNRIGGFHESPAQIVVGPRRRRAEPALAAAGVNGRHQTGITGQTLRAGESPDIADLRIDRGSEYLACAGIGFSNRTQPSFPIRSRIRTSNSPMWCWVRSSISHSRRVARRVSSGGLPMATDSIIRFFFPHRSAGFSPAITP